MTRRESELVVENNSPPQFNNCPQETDWSEMAMDGRDPGNSKDCLLEERRAIVKNRREKGKAQNLAITRLGLVQILTAADYK